MLAEVDSAVRAHRNGQHDSQYIAHLHDRIHSCEVGHLFDEYVEESVPTFERMFHPLPERIEKAKQALRVDAEKYGAETVADEMRILALLSGREQQVQTAVQRYVQSVIRFDTLRRLSYGGVRADMEQFSDADHARRRSHNALIDTLRVYLKVAQEAEAASVFPKESSGPVFVPWDIGVDARVIPRGHILVFSEKTLEHREFVRDWAVASFFAACYAESNAPNEA